MNRPNYNDVSDDAWRSESLCLGKHPDLWFPPLDKTVGNVYIPIGKAVCQQCPVWQQCLNEGLDEHWGTWGGLSTKERQVFHNPASLHLGRHGSVVRYRQGCRCLPCTTAHTVSSRKSLNLAAVPNAGDEVLGRPDVLKKLIYKFS